MASPLNKRLLAVAPAARRHLLLTGVAQAMDAVLTVVRAALIGITVATLIEEHRTRWDLVGLLGAVVLAHSLVVFVAQRWASKSIGSAVDQLRSAALRALARRDPREVEAEAAHWRVTLDQGLHGIRPYLSDYVPALVSTCIATPGALAVMAFFDLPSAVLAAVTLPLIPLFMVLIGTLTRAHTERRLQITALLSGQLADLLQGAPTLRALGRTTEPREQLLRTGARNASATLSVLRLAFLSSFALEFLATLSVALVAVSIGLRLVVGEMTLLAGLVALIIAPEVYAPLRKVGASFHAAVDGMSAADNVFDLVDSPVRLAGTYRIERDEGIVVRDLSVQGRDGIRPRNLSFRSSPGTITVLAGPNGSGKSTALLAVLGLLPDEAVTGAVEAPPLSRTAYLPAHPAFVQGTVAENLALLGPAPTPEIVSAFGCDFPLSQPVYQGGSGISAGQGQRLAIARACGNEARTTLLLDEPSAHLSPEYVRMLCAELRELANAGHTLLISSHDRRILDIADQVIQL